MYKHMDIFRELQVLLPSRDDIRVFILRHCFVAPRANPVLLLAMTGDEDPCLFWRPMMADAPGFPG